MHPIKRDGVTVAYIADKLAACDFVRNQKKVQPGNWLVCAAVVVKELPSGIRIPVPQKREVNENDARALLAQYQSAVRIGIPEHVKYWVDEACRQGIALDDWDIEKGCFTSARIENKEQSPKC